MELLAFAADTLSYRQDVIANEAYLNTARTADLGPQARAPGRLLPARGMQRARIRPFPGDEGASDQSLPPSQPLDHEGDEASDSDGAGRPRRTACARRRRADLRNGPCNDAACSAHNRFSFYTWGDAGCCLARGATAATLEGPRRGLAAGDFLAFQEVVSPTKFSDGRRGSSAPTYRSAYRASRWTTIHPATLSHATG